MLQRLDAPEGKDPEQARREFDNSLGVSGWRTPGAGSEPAEEREPGAPLWWQGEEEASAAFLMSQGVVLNG